MKKSAVLLAACLCAGAALAPAEAQEVPFGLPFGTDSLVYELSGSVVSAALVPKDAPFAVSRIDQRELSDFAPSPQELPFLFARTPGVLAWGDNGIGSGTSYLRIRGAGDSRINVTLDGVPLNSPEDQCVFWANMNSYASFLGEAVIQRGIGSSSNGDGAFGGTVALSTRQPSLLPASSVDLSYGSFNTFKWGASFSSGLVGRHLVFDGNFHQTSTDGYMHGTAGRSGSWLAGVTWLGGALTLRYRNIGNFEHTGQAWNGVDSGDMLDGNYGVSTGVYGYADLYRLGLGRYNSLCEAYMTTGEGTLTFAPYMQRTTDNFVQDHNILSATWQMSDFWTAHAALHYTYGAGYYDEFRPGNKLSKFGLANFVGADGSTVKKTDFVRKKGLTQHTYGVVASVNGWTERADLHFGLSAQQFRGNHYGFLTYMGHPELRAKYMAGGDYQYYDSDAVKTDASVYTKASLLLGAGLTAFADLQYRFVHYRTDGINDKFYALADGSYANQRLDIDKAYHFFNPKAGLEYKYGVHSAFASVALGNREPERNNFTDNGSYPAPVPERMLDYELGYGFAGRRFQGNVTFYYMDYRNQFVRTGAVSDIGEALTTNIAKSYRARVELSAGVQVCSWLDLDATAALSRNRILDFDEVVEDWDKGEQVIHYDQSTLAFSPSAILGGGFTLQFGAFKAVWRTSYVSRQFIDNTECLQRSLPAYSTTDVDLSYTIVPRWKWIRDIRVGATLGNIFDSHHACSAWVYSAIYESGGNPNDHRYTQIGYFPAAGFTAIGTLAIRF